MKKRSTKTRALAEMHAAIARGLADPTPSGVGVTSGKVNVGDVMSNFDRKIDVSVVAHLRNNPGTCATYHAWDFQGQVWHEDGRWKCEVWQHRQPVAVCDAASPLELMNLVSEVYGYD